MAAGAAWQARLRAGAAMRRVGQRAPVSLSRNRAATIFSQRRSANQEGKLRYAFDAAFRAPRDGTATWRDAGMRAFMIGVYNKVALG